MQKKISVISPRDDNEIEWSSIGNILICVSQKCFKLSSDLSRVNIIDDLNVNSNIDPNPDYFTSTIYILYLYNNGLFCFSKTVLGQTSKTDVKQNWEYV